MSAEVATTVARVRAWREDRRRAGERVGFVPTMGALHAGHARLIETARQRGDHVIVSIFVNQLQFDRKDDLDKYPRTLEADAFPGAAPVLPPRAHARNGRGDFRAH